MSSNMRIFYLYTVSLITLLLFLAGIGFTVYNSAKYIFPNNYVFFDDDGGIVTFKTDVVANNNNEIRKQNYKRETIKDLAVSVLVVAIGFSLYKYHWNKIEKERVLLNNDVKGENV